MSTIAYRRDIDSLRAIAVVAVIIFHYGYLPNGYLGVDIFYVISGYIITTLMLKEIKEESFTLKDFYLRRIRRIIPLTTVVILVVLAVGIMTMLPDDLENLAESVVATNFFANNILQAVTTRNYWDVVNEYKPLMHTWSLGIEEQFYLIYPIIIYHLSRNGTHRTRPAILVLILLTLASILLYLGSYRDYVKFYYIPFRFWELSVGALAAFMSLRLNHGGKALSILLTATLMILLSAHYDQNHDFKLFVTVLLTATILTAQNHGNFFLYNGLLSFIGKISFGLYMWHQPVLAFSRYIWIQSLSKLTLCLISMAVLALAIITYYTIEKPFRNKKIISTRMVLIIIIPLIAFTTSISLILYRTSGVWHDIPELDIDASHVVRNMHQQYNHRIHERNRMFLENKSLVKVLVIGNSFARDWANVLLESQHAQKMDIIYVYRPETDNLLSSKIESADIIFCSECTRDEAIKYRLMLSKTWVIGTKNFGASNGIYYNYRGLGYENQRTHMQEGYYASNENLRNQWRDNFIDYLSKVVDNQGTVPVFTPEGKFISQDTRHFTKAGARYFAKLLDQDIQKILSRVRIYTFK